MMKAKKLHVHTMRLAHLIFIFLIKNRSLVYRGQLDDSRPENGIPVTGNDMRSALEAICNGKEITVTQKPSIGCNIKWKS